MVNAGGAGDRRTSIPEALQDLVERLAAQLQGARLVADLTHPRDAQHEAQESVRRATKQLDALQAVEQRNGEMTAQLAELGAQAQALREQLTAETEKVGVLAAQVRNLELVLAQSQARYEAQKGIVAELRAYLDGRHQQASKG